MSYCMSLKMGAIVLGVTLMASGVARAQEEGALDGNAVNSGKVSFNLGFDITTAYYFRGIIQENQGFIIQPYADVTFNLHRDDDGLIRSLDVYTGIWNALTDQQTGGGDAWYELDYFAGVTIGLPASFTFDVSYMILDTPGGAFGLDHFAQEVGLKLSYDDSKFWEDLGVNLPGFTGLQPHFKTAIETDNASDGVGNGGDVYYEVGIAPAVTLIQSQDYPLTLTIPVVAGFGTDYYQFDTNGNGTPECESFGYVDVGLVFSMPLAFMPAEMGAWTVSAGAHFLFLGDTTKAANAGDNFEAIGTFGLSMSY